jgi:hypothetical protein
MTVLRLGEGCLEVEISTEMSVMAWKRIFIRNTVRKEEFHDKGICVSSIVNL